MVNVLHVKMGIMLRIEIVLLVLKIANTNVQKHNVKDAKLDGLEINALENAIHSAKIENVIKNQGRVMTAMKVHMEKLVIKIAMDA